MKKETVNKFLICICFIICMIPNALNAQSKKPLNMPLYDEEPYHFGAILGYNQMMFSMNYKDGYQNIIHNPSELPDNIPGIGGSYTTSDFMVYDINTKIGQGFTVGMVGSVRLARHFDFRFTPSLSFGSRHITYTLVSLQEDPIEGVPNEKKFPVNIKSDTHTTFVEFPFHIKYKSKRNYNSAAYILAGVNYKIDWEGKNKGYDKNTGNPIELNVKHHDFAAEIGAGFDFYTGYFKLGIELKMSYGLLDVTKDKDFLFSSSFDKLRNKGFQLSFTFE